MKRSFKMIVMMLALTFGALIFNGASSQAAVSITNVKNRPRQAAIMWSYSGMLCSMVTEYITVYIMVHLLTASQVTVTLPPPMRHCII